MPGFEITPNDLMFLIGGPDAPVVADVRTGADFDDDPVLIPGARRIGHGAPAAPGGLRNARARRCPDPVRRRDARMPVLDAKAAR